MEILQRYANLFWILWTCLVTITQNDSITLLKTSMLIFMQKGNFIIHFFFTIYYILKNPAIRCRIWPINRDPKYARYVGEKSIAILVFIIDYFQEKLTWQNFSKNPQNPILGPIWALFAQIWARNEFSWRKRVLSVF